MPLTRPPETLTALRGVGPKIAEALQRLGIMHPRDLIFHLPVRYEDRTQLTTLDALRTQMPVLLEGRIVGHHVAPGRRPQAVLNFEDVTGRARIRLFHFSRAYLQTLGQANAVRLFGEPRWNQGMVEFIHPEIQVYRETPPPLEDRLTPIYPTTEGLTQPRLRDLISQVLNAGPDAWALEELLSLTHRNTRPPLWDALIALHCPARHLPPEPYVERLALEELLAHRLLLMERRRRLRAVRAPACAIHIDSRHQLLAALPFTLTDAQARVITEIDADLAEPVPMMRLLQGDVGSGKTLVAAMTALTVLSRGYQVALMAPTELLAEQHLREFVRWYAPLGISVHWLSGSIKGRVRRETLAAIAVGEARLVIGTHALFQDQVVLSKLGFVIIDEQHRFGVAQRLQLHEKGGQTVPHQLIMTATPIPRTLAMTQFADLDISIIDALPPGRTPIETRLVPQTRDLEMIHRIDAQLDTGGQVYWVCTLIEESDQLSAEAAETRTFKLQEQLPHRRIGLVHGRLKSDEKGRVMQAFAEGNLDVLVATTVIEVGVNVPNAHIMVIENPERLGLAQLHQLRGRVGRGRRESYCILLYGPDLGRDTVERLTLVRDTLDGFALAEADLRLRGPGEVSGTRQTGELAFRVAQLEMHGHLLDEVVTLAEALSGDEATQQRLLDRWIGNRESFAHV
jgi:ATP-dependent DNA helicase RecG